MPIRHPLLLLLALGCSSEPADGDTAAGEGTDPAANACETPYEGPTVVGEVVVTCEGDAVTFRVETEGASASAIVYTFDTIWHPHWDEEHDLVPVEEDACGAYTVLERSLEIVPALDSNIRNETSGFTCANQYDYGALTYVVTVFDADGAFAGCVAFGSDPAGVLSGAWDNQQVNGTSTDVYFPDCEIR